MSDLLAAPLLLAIVVGLLLGLMGWHFLRTRIRKSANALTETGDDFLLGLLVLAAFAIGVFVAYVVVGLF